MSFFELSHTTVPIYLVPFLHFSVELKIKQMNDALNLYELCPCQTMKYAASILSVLRIFPQLADMQNYFGPSSEKKLYEPLTAVQLRFASQSLVIVE